ncbi:MAG: hypothetical protein JRG92_06570 [Deltaproteobacteria bacterium]|nr:hypothetical protein [Deltaproteobacteria bacterium]
MPKDRLSRPTTGEDADADWVAIASRRIEVRISAPRAQCGVASPAACVCAVRRAAVSPHRRRQLLGVVFSLALAPAFAAQAQMVGFGPVAALNTNAASDSGWDTHPQVTTDGVGNWVAVWNSSDSLGATIGSDFDIFFATATATATGPDTDGLSDGEEVNVYGTDPLDSDSDGLSDRDELDVVATDPLEPDSDGDGFCDGPDTGGGSCSAGDNCPRIFDTSQTNSDSLFAGDIDDCGVDDHFIIDRHVSGTSEDSLLANECGASGMP